MMTDPKTKTNNVETSPRRLFMPSRRSRLVLFGLSAAVLGAALYMRYGIIQNTPLGLACEAGRVSPVCTIRLAVISLFNYGIFGGVAMVAAVLQFWRPNVYAFGIGLVAALPGLVLYNTNVSAFAFALLLLSLARPVSEGPSRQAA